MKYLLLFATINNGLAGVLAFIFALDVAKHEVEASSVGTLFHMDSTKRKDRMNYGNMVTLQEIRDEPKKPHILRDFCELAWFG